MTPNPTDTDPPPAAARTASWWDRSRRFVRGKLSWNRLFGASSYLKSALWTVPIVAIAIELVVTPILHRLDAWLGWEFAGLAVSGAQAIDQTVISLTLAFLVFTFGSLLVAIQVAGGQMTPRVIATALLRDNVVRYSVGLFTFTLVFAVGALNRLEASVHQLVAFAVAALGVACIADFLFLIDYAARLLRPVSIVARIGNEGITVIKAVYPEPTERMVAETAGLRALLGTPACVVLHSGTSEIVLAVDLPTLVAEAARCEGIIEFLPQVGDFVAADEPLFALYGGASAANETMLRTTVAFGPERTLEQDPMFAFRILVDIALKALSPAINDPTTAVLALDQIHRLLRVLGKRRLRPDVVQDDAGRPRVIFRTPNWEDFVHVACNEIRTCGAGSVQVARRMRALLQNLVLTLPGHRHPALHDELEALDRTIEKLYSLAADRALARIPDAQGLGGAPTSLVREREG